MTDKTPIRKLIEAVERGTASEDESLNAFPIMDYFDNDGENGFLVQRAYHGSLDAALALHEALLPGWYGKTDTDGTAYVSDYAKKLLEAKAYTPARAWLIAILKAYEAQQ